MILIEKAFWDSDFFGYEVGRLNINSNHHFSVEDLISSAKAYKLVYVFSDDAINSNKLNLVDEKVTLSLDLLGFNNEVNDELKTVSFKDVDFEESDLKELAFESGTHSRFKVDPNIKESEFRALYSSWIDQSLNGKLAFDILFVFDEGSLIGFISLSEKDNLTSKIGLIAVSESVRGKGVAKTLINAAVKLSVSKGYSFMEVVTQNQNKPAMNLYQKLGFKIEDIQYIYHLWNI